MRKYLFLFLMFTPFVAFSQVTFGYYKHSELIKQLPQYAQAEADYNELLTRCNEEVERNEYELNRIYVSFLEGRSKFPEPIMRKRQKELQEMVDKSILFRSQIKEWLGEARDSLFAPLEATIKDAVNKVCLHNNLAFIIDTDKAGFAAVNPALGFDVTEAVLATIANNGEPQTVIATGNPKNAAEQGVVQPTDSVMPAHEQKEVVKSEKE